MQLNGVPTVVLSQDIFVLLIASVMMASYVFGAMIAAFLISRNKIRRLSCVCGHPHNEHKTKWIDKRCFHGKYSKGKATCDCDHFVAVRE